MTSKKYKKQPGNRKLDGSWKNIQGLKKRKTKLIRKQFAEKENVFERRNWLLHNVKLIFCML